MNYARVRELSKKKLIEKREALSKLNGKDRTKAEQMLMEQAKDEVRQGQKEVKKEVQEEIKPAPKKRGRKPKAK